MRLNVLYMSFYRTTRHKQPGVECRRNVFSIHPNSNGRADPAAYRDAYCRRPGTERSHHPQMSHFRLITLLSPPVPPTVYGGQCGNNVRKVRIQTIDERSLQPEASDPAFRFVASENGLASTCSYAIPCYNRLIFHLYHCTDASILNPIPATPHLHRHLYH